MALAPPPDGTVVSTLPFELDPRVFCRALLTTYFRRNVWTYVICVAVAGVGLVLDHSFLLFLGLWTGIVLALYRLWWFRRYVRHPDNASFFTTRRYDLTVDALHAVTADGTEATQPLASLVRAENDGSHWRLYESTANAHFVPVSAFASPDDLVRFLSLLREHGLIRD